MSQLTLKEMVQEVMDFTSDHSADADSRIRRWLNAHYDKLAKIRSWEDLIERRDDAAMVFVANQAYLAFPEDCALPLSIHDQTDDYTLKPISISQQEEDYITLQGTAGTPVIHYAPIGYKATLAPLSAADELAVLTELSTDSSVDIIITGVRNSPDVRDREIIQTHATTPQTTSVAGTVIWRPGWSISSISVKAGLNGYITIHEQSTSGNVLARLTEHSRASRYYVIQLQNEPDSANQLTLVYKRRVLPLVEDDDAPIIPVSESLIQSAIAEIRAYDGEYSQAREHRNQANEYLNSVVSEQAGQDRVSMRARPAAAKFRRRPMR